jgi:hypothetical protein
VRGTRFGRPVEPDEYWKMASASGEPASSVAAELASIRVSTAETICTSSVQSPTIS